VAAEWGELMRASDSHGTGRFTSSAFRVAILVTVILGTTYVLAPGAGAATGVIRPPAGAASSAHARTGMPLLKAPIEPADVSRALLAKLRRGRDALGIAVFSVPPQSVSSAPAALAKRRIEFSRIKSAALANTGARIVERWPNLALALVRIPSLTALSKLASDPAVTAIRADETFRATSNQHLNFIGQPDAAASGAKGAGTYVGVIDTGLNYNYSDFGTCAGGPGSSGCKVQGDFEIAPDDGSLDDSGHGSNVASIVTQVAPGTKIFGYDVFNGANADFDDVATALDDLIRLRGLGWNVVSANMSIGGAFPYSGDCSSSYPDIATALQDTRNAGIVPIVSAGNNAANGSFGVAAPGCVAAAFSVGAVYDSNVGSFSWQEPPTCTDSTTYADKVACFSQTAKTLDVLAPGTDIYGAGNYWTGTSQAAPHVAGAVAVLKGAVTNAGVSQIESALRSSGPSDIDNRFTTSVTTHRLYLPSAISTLKNVGDTTAPVVTAPVENVTGQITSTIVPVKETWSATDSGGIAAYSLWSQTDGGTWVKQTLSPATSTSTVFNLTKGHSYRFAVAAQDAAGNWSGYKYGPTFTVRVSDDNNTNVSYSSGWTRLSSSLSYGGFEVGSVATGATATFTFKGRDVSWVAPRWANGGEAYVYLDGTYSKTIDLYASSTSFRKAVYWARWPSVATRTITVEVVGTANRPQVDVDAFVVLG